jgi:hypothetical protein
VTGFITFNREATEHPLFKGEPARLGAWFWLVAKACWKPTKFDIQGKIVTLERGQLSVSRSQLAKAWGMSESAVERFLTRLQTEQMIERATGQGRSIITICNYAKYQDKESKAGQATGQATGQRPDSQRTAKEQGNKEPNGSIGDNPPTPHRDPDWIDLPDWLPAESWNGWLEMRRKKRAWPTALAVEKTINKLAEFRTCGHDPGRVLDESTMNNWTGVFELKESKNGNHNRQAAGGPSAGNRGHLDRRGHFERSLDQTIFGSGSEHPAGTAGRWDDSDPAGDRELPLAGPGHLR